MNVFRSLISTVASSFVLLLLHGTILAQPGNSGLAFPSANNSFLGKSGSGATVGVDEYTGTAQVSIPLYALSSQSTAIPITVDYADGRGVPVQEYATQVGLGWQLNAGGSISRVVRGLPDEELNGYLGIGNNGTNWGSVVSYPASQAWQNGAFNFTTFNTTISSANYEALAGVNSKNEPTADGEPDIFYVKTPFFAFQFVFDPSGKPVFSNYNGFKVIANNFIANPAVTPTSPVNATFEVLDDKGDQFYFGNTTNSTEISTDTLFGNQISFPTTWYLTKIVTFNSQDVINFTYQAATTTDVTYNYSWTELLDVTTNQKTFIESTGKNVVQGPLYVSIISTALGEADFTYAFDRQDDANAGRLSQLVVKAYNPQTSSNSTTLKTYNFNYSYFNASSGNSNLERLCLNNVTETGSGGPTITLASFGYNTSVNLPDRTQWVYDYWGYCTTVQSPTPTDLASVNRNPDPTMAQADVLNTITTGFGGTWNLYYQLNDFLPTGASANLAVGGLRVWKLSETLPTGEIYNKTYNYVAGNGLSSGEIYSSFYNALSYNFQPNDFTTLYLSNSPYVTNDVNGVFVGYSFVQEMDQDKGYTLYNFTNFNDGGSSDGTFVSVTNNPNTRAILIPSTSLAYRRGLLKTKSVYSFNPLTSSYSPVSITSNNYTPQQTMTNDAYGFRPINFLEGSNSQGPVIWTYYGLYSTPVENYLLSSTVQTNYDQVTGSAMLATVNYQYDINATTNTAYMNYTSSTDSKNQNHTQTYYFPSDGASIPTVVAGSAEAQTITDMVNGNRLNVPIHEIDSRNTLVHATHNTYGEFVNGSALNIYPISTSLYTGNTLVSQQLFNYSTANSQLTTSNVTPGKPIATAYGYNSAYPIVKVVNASNTASTANVAFGMSGTLLVTQSLEGQQRTPSFNTFGTNNVNVSVFSAGGTINFGVQLIGTNSSSQLETICSSTISGACPAFLPSSYTFTNVPAGTYYLTVVQNTDPGGTAQIPVSYSYTGSVPRTTGVTEFFFEGFEQNPSATAGAAHTGNMYMNANYTVPYTIPNSRTYLIQWWSLQNGVWVFNQNLYTNGMTLSGPVDDVRVFPQDALMTTYTYSPLLGKTSETDPSGKSTNFQYDGLGRPLRMLDQYGNILKQYDYEYQAPLHQ